MTIYGFLNKIKKHNICIWYDNEKLKAFLPKNEKIHADEKEFIDNNKPEILKVLKSNSVYTKEDFHNRKIYKNINDSTDFGLSSAQESLWFIEQYEKGSSAYNIPFAFDLGRDADIDSFKKSIQSIVSRHEVLRTVFRKDNDGNDYQFVLDSQVQILEEKIFEEELSGKLKDSINSVFDLVDEGPLKVSIFITDKSIYSLINIHHIAFDGWSSEIFINELEKFYLKYKENRELKLPDLDIQYKDFAVWQKEYLSGDEFAKQLSYWKNKIKGYETLEFPTDRPRPSHIDYRGDDVNFELSEDVSEKLKSIAKDKGVTLYTVLLSAFYILLNKYTGQESLIIGTPVANRNYTQLENLIGYFVNSLALKTELNPDLTFDTLIEHVQSSVIEAQKYQDLPFEKLVDALNVEQVQSRHPVFQIMFGVQSFGGNEERLFRTIPLYNYYKPAKFDLSLFIDDRGNNFRGSFNYALSLFERAAIERLKGHFLNILVQVAADRSCRLKHIKILSDREYRQIVYDWNKTAPLCPGDKTIVELFEEQVGKTPDNTALIFEDEKLTYRELNERANQLAHTIRRD